MRLLGGGQKHPRNLTPLAIHASRWRLPVLMGGYAATTLTFAALHALVIWRTSTEKPSYGHAFRIACASIWSTADTLGLNGQSWLYYVFGGISSLASIILPIFVLGAFVFRLFRYDPLVWRRKASVAPFRSLPQVLSFRTYNGTKDDIVNLRIQVVARISGRSQPPVRRDYPMPVYVIHRWVPDPLREPEGGKEFQALLDTLRSIGRRMGRPLDLGRAVQVDPDRLTVTETRAARVQPADPVVEGSTRKAGAEPPLDDQTDDEITWLLSPPGWPFTVRVPIRMDQDFVYFNSERERYPRTDVEFVVLATGTSAASGEGLSSVATYSAATDVVEGHPQDVFLDPSRPMKQWEGWANFEGHCSIYLFVYGTFLTDLAKNLGYKPARPPMAATLRGYRRRWNIAFDGESHQHLSILDAEKKPFPHAVAGLSVEREEDANCVGTVIRLTSHDLTLVGERQRNFVQQDVTDLVTWQGRDPDETCIVYTLVASEEARGRLLKAKDDGRPIHVAENDYQDLVRGLTAWGLDPEIEAPVPDTFIISPLTISYIETFSVPTETGAPRSRAYGTRESS